MIKTNTFQVIKEKQKS